MFEKLLVQLAQSLDKHHIPYMIIGGQAVLLYGDPRLTKDIDITLGITPDQLPLIQDVSKSLQLKILSENTREFVGKTMVLPTLHSESGIRVDFIFSFTPYEQLSISRAKSIQLLDTIVKFTSPEDLIIHKIFAGRPRDLEDVQSIIRKVKEIDKDYIIKWLTEFTNLFPEKDFSKTFLNILNANK